VTAPWSVTFIPVWLATLLYACIPLLNWSALDSGDGKRLFLASMVRGMCYAAVDIAVDIAVAPR
jgi:hypothetical protein